MTDQTDARPAAMGSAHAISSEWSEKAMHLDDGLTPSAGFPTPADPVAVARAALEYSISRLRDLVPEPANGPFSHTNTARVCALDAVSAIRALVNDPAAIAAIIAIAQETRHD